MTVGQVDKEISVANQMQRVVMGVSILRYWYIDTRMSIDRVLITLIKYRSGQLLDCVKCVHEQYILKLLNAKYLSCFLVGLKISQSIVSNKKKQNRFLLVESTTRERKNTPDRHFYILRISNYFNTFRTSM